MHARVLRVHVMRMPMDQGGNAASTCERGTSMELSTGAHNIYDTDESENYTAARHERPVDLVHLARQTLGDKDLECEVLELFRRQSLSSVSKMKEAETEDAWRSAAHMLKGSARGVGAWPVADLAQQIEQLAGSEQASDREKMVQALERVVASTNDYIIALLDEN